MNIQELKTAFNRFYELLYAGVIDEDTISLTIAEQSVKTYKNEFNALCDELHDILISDREYIAFYLSVEFLTA